MMTLTISTPERHVLGPIEVSSVTLPGGKGEFTVLPGHARLLSTLEVGVMNFETADGKKEFAAVSGGGFTEVFEDKVIVLADTFELAHEIDLERARKAEGKAQERLKAKENFIEDLEEAQRKLQRSLVRQEVTQYLLPPH